MSHSFHWIVELETDPMLNIDDTTWSFKTRKETKTFLKALNKALRQDLDEYLETLDSGTRKRGFVDIPMKKKSEYDSLDEGTVPPVVESTNKYRYREYGRNNEYQEVARARVIRIDNLLLEHRSEPETIIKGLHEKHEGLDLTRQIRKHYGE